MNPFAQVGIENDSFKTDTFSSSFSSGFENSTFSFKTYISRFDEVSLHPDIFGKPSGPVKLIFPFASENLVPLKFAKHEAKKVAVSLLALCA